MTQLLINVGNVANDGQGTPLRTAFQYINSNFTELYNNVQTAPPSSSSGQEGDVPGMIAFDQQYLYVCVYEYDATTIIWYRIAFDTSPW
jgi:hypothetical protein